MNDYRSTIRSIGLVLFLVAVCSVGYTNDEATAHKRKAPTVGSVANSLSKLECSPAVVGYCHKYRPVTAEGNSLRVDCNHARVHCDDENS